MTSLYNPMTTINTMPKALEHPYKGKVVQVDSDPNYIGRIKVDIPELFGTYYVEGEQNSAGILPWIYPRFLGQFHGQLNFAVPEVGEVVEVEFPYKNIYLGYYTNKPLYKGFWDNLSQQGLEDQDGVKEGAKIASKFKANYPYVYGNIDSNLTGWYVDKVSNEIFMVQGGMKANITMNSEGTIIVNSPKNMIFNAQDSIYMTAQNLVQIISNDKMVINSANQIDSTTQTYNLTTSNINSKGQVKHSGAISTDSTITSSGDQVAGGISTMHHTHPYSWGHEAGSSSTQQPQ